MEMDASNRLWTGTDDMKHCPTVQLTTGVQTPLLGLDTWPMDNDKTASAVETALANGHRLFDTAESYGSETDVV